MKTLKKIGIRPLFISSLDIQPTKLKRGSSIRPAKSLRQNRMQVRTPLRAILNKNFEELSKLED